MVRYKSTRNGLIPFTAEEETARDLEEQAWADDSSNRKLKEIKNIRLSKLRETDYLANTDMTMTQVMKDYRQGMRDIPQNNSTEEQYDLILAKDEQGNLTNPIWSKP
jgi:Iap family predicted aminopeptidase